MILITGGTGYIGAHVAKCFKPHEVVLFDRYEHNATMLTDYTFEQGNCLDGHRLFEVFRKHKPTSVIHMAALKEVEQSTMIPETYIHNNISALTSVMQVMAAFSVPKIVFSSSCSVYGNCEGCGEDAPYNPQSPYAFSKQICEQLLIASKFNYSILRYFNPIGEIGGLRDFSQESLQNRMKRTGFKIYGSDYDTPDGTPVRDFIPIDQLAKAHISALTWDRQVVNVGTGTGRSVLQVAQERGVGYELAPRRPGDIPAVWANTDKFKSLTTI